MTSPVLYDRFDDVFGGSRGTGETHQQAQEREIAQLPSAGEFIDVWQKQHIEVCFGKFNNGERIVETALQLIAANRPEDADKIIQLKTLVANYFTVRRDYNKWSLVFHQSLKVLKLPYSYYGKMWIVSPETLFPIIEAGASVSLMDEIMRDKCEQMIAQQCVQMILEQPRSYWKRYPKTKSMMPRVKGSRCIDKNILYKYMLKWVSQGAVGNYASTEIMLLAVVKESLET